MGLPFLDIGPGFARAAWVVLGQSSLPVLMTTEGQSESNAGRPRFLGRREQLSHLYVETLPNLELNRVIGMYLGNAVRSFRPPLSFLRTPLTIRWS